MRRPSTLIAAAVISVLLVAGCGGVRTAPFSASGPAGPPSSSALASAPPCTTHACIVADAKQLVGTVAADESVITSMTCYVSTVRNPAPGVWTVSCVAGYSDGTQADGIASVLVSQSKITWEPTGIVSG